MAAQQHIQDPFLYKCVIQRIVDGDTIDVNIDLGFGIWLYKERVRIAGIDTPEKRTRDKVEKIFGLAATAKAHTLIPEGSNVIIRTHRDKAGKYGRTMGEFIMEDGRYYTEVMVETHHDPDNAWSDAAQQVTPSNLIKIIKNLKII